MTTRQMIKGWLNDPNRGKIYGNTLEDITHMLVVCDTFDWEDYPVYVTKDEDVRKKYDEYNGPNMQKVMEVYSYSHNLEDQLNEGRAFHYD